MDSKIHGKRIEWEDEDTDFEPELNKRKENERKEFETLLNESKFDMTRISEGQKIEGILSVISDDTSDVLVEISDRFSGVIDKSQLKDAEGKLKYRQGDKISAYVISRSFGSIQLSMTLDVSRAAERDLDIAFKNQVPVKGKVVKENKGGFEISIFGKKAFCPVSQIDIHYVENKAEYLGKDYEFLIEKYEKESSDLVVSRSKLLKLAAELKMKEFESNLTSDMIFDGVVKEIKDFGIIVNISGVEGLVHISEMSHARITSPKDFIQVGEKVRVKVLSIENKDGKKRVSLSMKAAEEDPWSHVTENFNVSSNYSGKVTRLTKFGAFVELTPGVEGMIHISEMSWEKRVHDPSQMVKEGDRVTVRILDINTETQKISLSLKNIEENPWHDIQRKFPVGATVKGRVERLKGFGAIVELSPGVTGLVPINILKTAWGEGYRKKASPPKDIDVTILAIDEAEKRISLSLPDIKADTEHEEAYKRYVREMSLENKVEDKMEKKDKTEPAGSFGALLAKKLGEKTK
ncbi:MAG: S1 RNA-binding domain-containing protein [Oligoflexales bacterium]|nr:S1 RNA-binding domain-containing protein [Oligoflexales bacterium]